MKKYFCDVCGKEFDPAAVPAVDVAYPARDACPSAQDVCPACLAVGKSLEVEQLVLDACTRSRSASHSRRAGWRLASRI